MLGGQLGGGQDGAVGRVVLGDVLADADGGLGVAEEDGFESSDERAGIGLAESQHDWQGGRVQRAVGFDDRDAGGVRGVGGCGGVGGGGRSDGRSQTVPKAPQPAGGGLQGMIQHLPTIGPDVGQIGAEQEAVDQIDLVVGLGFSEGGADFAVGDSVGRVS